MATVLGMEQAPATTPSAATVTRPRSVERLVQGRATSSLLVSVVDRSGPHGRFEEVGSGEAILRFEPRILPETLTVRALETSSVLDTHNMNEFEIHGQGGVGQDWTWGCIAVDNSVIDILWPVLGVSDTIVVAP